MRWSNLAERGTILGIMVLTACNRFLGNAFCYFIGAPVVFYFFLACTKQRQASQQFLKRAGQKTSLFASLRHFMSFFRMMLDKMTAQCGRISFDSVEFEDPETIHRVLSAPGGGVLFVSHLGCIEYCQALMSEAQKKRMHILLHSKNAVQFNRVMAYFNPQTNLNSIEVSEVGPDTIMFLKERVENNEWVVIAADRTPIAEGARVTYAPFLGAEAPFSQGPYILASLLQVPVYTAMAIRVGSKYKVFFEHFAEKIILQRGRKEDCIREYATQYSKYLEKYCIQHPYQWFNFYDFWGSVS